MCHWSGEGDCQRGVRHQPTKKKSHFRPFDFSGECREIFNFFDFLTTQKKEKFIVRHRGFLRLDGNLYHKFDSYFILSKR